MKKTQLFKDAVIEAKELREAAEKQVRQQIMENLSPIIKKALNQQISTLIEEDVGLEVSEFEDPAASEQAPLEPAMPVVPVEQSVAVTDNALTTPEPAMPIATGNDLNMSLPGPDGMITVNFDDLFNNPENFMKSPDVATVPTEEPVISTIPEPAIEQPIDPAQTGEVTPEDNTSFLPPEIPLAEGIRKKFINLVEEFVTESKTMENPSLASIENMQLALIALVEEGEELVKNKLIEASDLSFAKKRAKNIQNIIQEKMNSAREQDSYKQNGEKMALKKNLKKLFEEAELAFADLDVDAARKELVQDEKELAKADPGTDAIGEKSKDGEWDKEGAKAAASESEAEKSALEEAIALFKAALSLNEDEDVSKIFADETAVDDSTDSSTEVEEETDEEFDIEALLQDFEKELEEHGISLDNLDVEVSKDAPGTEDDFDLHFKLDDEGDVVDAGASTEESIEGVDDESEVVIAEATKYIQKAKKALVEAKEKASDLELYNSKTIHLNKLLMQEALSNPQEKKAAIMALDEGKTVQEVEKIYNRIVTHKLHESKSARNSKAKVVAENSKLISESKAGEQAVLSEGANPFVQRMQELARISPKK